MKHQTWIRRIALFLCVALVLPTLLLATPSVDAQAASAYKGGLNYYYCRDAKGNYSTRNIKVQVEAGQKFVIGDWVDCYKISGYVYKYCKLTDLKGTKYKSSNKKVMAVTSKGVATTKKTGTTTITMKNGKVNVKLQIQVVKKGSLTKQVKNSATYQTRINEAIKSAGTKVNWKNYETFFTKLDAAEKLNRKMKKMDGGILKKGNNYTNKVVIPQYATYDKYRQQLAAYIQDRPAVSFGTVAPSGKPETTMLSSSAITMTSASTGVLTLKKKVSLGDILKVQMEYISSSHFRNAYGTYGHTNYDAMKKAISKPYELENAVFSFVDADGYEAATLRISVSYGSDKATFKLEDGASLAAGTYTLDEQGQKYIGNLTVTVQ